MNPLLLLLGFASMSALKHSSGSVKAARELYKGKTDDGGEVVSAPVSEPEPEPIETPHGVSAPLSEPEPVVEPEPVETAPDLSAPLSEPAPAPSEPEPIELPHGVSAPLSEPEVETAPDLSAPLSEPEPAPVDDTVVLSEPEAPVQDGAGSGGGSGETVSAEGTVTVLAGRVTTLQPAGTDVASVRIVSEADAGSTTVNPDNSIALVLTQSDFTGPSSITYEVTASDGSTSLYEVGLDVQPGPQEGGWATGETQYMLATDADGRIVVEEGDDTVKVYVTGSNAALSLSDVAAAEGVSLSQVTGSFLLSRGYGQSEETALDSAAGKMLWDYVTPANSDSSNWFLYERGYEYGNALTLNAGGESELAPLYIGTWGEGSRPVIDTIYNNGNFVAENVVIQGLEFQYKQSALNVENLIIDDCVYDGVSLGIQNSSGVTLRDSYIANVSNPDGPISGAFFGNNDGLLLEGMVFDKIGWNETGDVADMFSHNLYIDRNNFDVTLRDTITMRAAAWGAHVRSGGFIEDVVFLDNNAAVDFYGGDFMGDGPEGNYTLFSNNVVTSAGYRTDGTGAFARGVEDQAYMTTFIDNIIANLWDPNNPDEIAQKTDSNGALISTKGAYYSDTIIWNWPQGLPSWNTPAYNAEELDAEILNATTIQLYTAALLGKDTATIGDLADILAQQFDGVVPDGTVTADDIIAWFQSGYGIDDGARTGAETARFVPNDLGDGVRWDNRMNWTTDDLPGTVVGDSADLGGNSVVFGTNATIEALDLGDGGALLAYGGRLDVEGGIRGGAEATLTIEGAGQVWADGVRDLDIEATGGRMANDGYVTDTDIDIRGEAQVILGSDGDQWEVSAGNRLAIFDAAAKVGFDGSSGGMAILDFDQGSTLAFTAGAEGLGTIEEFRSGAMGAVPDVLSGIDLEGATLEIDIAGLSASAGSAFTLMSADEIAGVLAEANVSGLTSGRDATIVVDYETDTVRLELTSGTGQTSVATVGAPGDVEAENDALWTALTADQGLADDSGPVFEEDLADVA